MCKNNF